MKSLILSCVSALLLVVFVFANSYAVRYNVEKISTAIESAPDNCSEKETYNKLYEDYRRREKYIALSVSHSDLLIIEDSFAEMLGAIDAEDEDALTIAKSRIIKALAHIKRLSGINFDSVF